MRCAAAGTRETRGSRDVYPPGSGKVNLETAGAAQASRNVRRRAWGPLSRPWRRALGKGDPMRYKAMFVAGFAVGFVAGARSGRETYDKMVAYAQQVAEHPKVQQATSVAQ